MVDRDGIAKPAILLIVEEALDAGIEEVVIIVQEDDLEDFRSFFDQQISIENFNKLPRHFQEYARRILDIGRRVTFVTQTAQEGFGHAVYCAREVIGDEPFLLMLGDHIYRSTGDVVLRAAARGGLPALGEVRRGAAADAGVADRGLRDRHRDLGRARGAAQHDGVRREAEPSTTPAPACGCRGCRTTST